MKLWWQFRDWLCQPFGHVLYVPRSWRFWDRAWLCSCQTIMIGGWRSGPNFRLYWNRMRRPVAECPKCGPVWGNKCPVCKGRGWVRA